MKRQGRIPKRLLPIVREALRGKPVAVRGVDVAAKERGEGAMM
jgi:hypothetical protein